MDTRKANAAMLVQRLFRGNKVRKHFDLTPLPLDKVSGDYAFPFGNDPEIVNIGQYIPANCQKVGLLATSSFRSILLACQLNLHHRVKTFVLDNSLCVQNLWSAMISFAETHSDQQAFLDDLNGFIEDNFEYINDPEFSDHYRSYEDMNNPTDTYYNATTKQFYPVHNAYMYFKSLFEEFGFSTVRKIILNTGFILQDWKNPAAFATVKHLFEFHGIQDIAVYPSNIIQSTVLPFDRLLILRNIKSLKPFLAMHSNLDPELGYPTKLMLIPNMSATEAAIQVCDDMPELVKQLIANKSALSNSFFTDKRKRESQDVKHQPAQKKFKPDSPIFLKLGKN